MAVLINSSTTAGLVLTSDTSGSLALQTAGTTAVTINSSQQLIAGTSSAYGNSKLTLIPSTNPTSGTDAYNQLFIGEASANSSYYMNVGYLNVSGGYSGSIQAIAGGVGTNLLLNPSGGNVGIGTTSPLSVAGRTLEVTGTTYAFSFVSDATSTVRGQMYADNANGLVGMGSRTNQSLILTTNNTERARIDTSGNLLVGATTSPSSSVSGVRISNPINGAVICSSGSTTTSVNQIAFVNGNGTVGTINTNGSATAYNTSSDYRLKENVQNMTGALAKVNQLRPVTYDWIADKSQGQGFIAHELQAVVPDCVTGAKDAVDKDGKPVYQAIDVSFLVATLTAAIQELQAKLKTAGVAGF